MKQNESEGLDMSKATPRPWKLSKSGFSIGSTYKSEFIAETIDQANAELIVRAVNCHEELVDALNWSLNQLYNSKTFYSGEDDKIQDLLKRARGEL